MEKCIEKKRNAFEILTIASEVGFQFEYLKIYFPYLNFL